MTILDDRDWRSKRALSVIMFLFTMIEGGGNERPPLSPFQPGKPDERTLVYRTRVGLRRKFGIGCLDKVLEKPAARGWIV